MILCKYSNWYILIYIALESIIIIETNCPLSIPFQTNHEGFTQIGIQSAGEALAIAYCTMIYLLIIMLIFRRGQQALLCLCGG